jgi:hypothetical protein
VEKESAKRASALVWQERQATGKAGREARSESLEQRMKTRDSSVFGGVGGGGGAAAVGGDADDARGTGSSNCSPNHRRFQQILE